MPRCCLVHLFEKLFHARDRFVSQNMSTKDATHYQRELGSRLCGVLFRVLFGVTWDTKACWIIELHVVVTVGPPKQTIGTKPRRFHRRKRLPIWVVTLLSMWPFQTLDLVLGLFLNFVWNLASKSGKSHSCLAEVCCFCDTL